MKKNKFNFLKVLYDVETDAYEFAQNEKKSALYKKHFYFWIFILVSFIALFSAFFLAILAALKLSKLWIFAENSGNNATLQNIIDNYVYITTIFNAVIAFVTTLISFFTFKQGYLKNRWYYKKINWELFQFDHKIGFYANQDYQLNASILIDRISHILEWKIDILNQENKEHHHE